MMIEEIKTPEGLDIIDSHIKDFVRRSRYEYDASLLKRGLCEDIVTGVTRVFVFRELSVTVGFMSVSIIENEPDEKVLYVHHLFMMYPFFTSTVADFIAALARENGLKIVEWTSYLDEKVIEKVFIHGKFRYPIRRVATVLRAEV